MELCDAGTVAKRIATVIAAYPFVKRVRCLNWLNKVQPTLYTLIVSELQELQLQKLFTEIYRDAE